ncbi:cytochrome-c peroxidase [Brevibacillus ginsengisoli]|uniref:cytochrome-c peroxidase n=1 Tax=Brevibacillus ginsengisoli TaxID=363854 RepID=UPI003CE8E90D
MKTRGKKAMISAVLFVAACIGLGGNWFTVTEAGAISQDDQLRAKYKSLGEVPVPVDNPMTQDKIQLGQELFADPRLSGNNKISCMTCHNPDLGFADQKEVAVGVGVGTRNTPTIIDTAYLKHLFMDGRVTGLEEQALVPIQNPVEMNQNLDELVKELKQVPEYRGKFKKAFQQDVSKETIAKALASFERTITQPHTRYDQYMAGDNQALSAQEKHGMELFAGKANCMTCHSGAMFTDEAPENIGMNNGDSGRYMITQRAEDWGSFRTSPLRNLVYTAPYMHDGSLKTLEEVVEFYNKGEQKDDNTSPDIKPLHLNEDEKKALVAFLKTLSGPPVKLDAASTKP